MTEKKKKTWNIVKFLFLILILLIDILPNEFFCSKQQNHDH